MPVWLLAFDICSDALLSRGGFCSDALLSRGGFDICSDALLGASDFPLDFQIVSSICPLRFQPQQPVILPVAKQT